MKQNQFNISLNCPKCFSTMIGTSFICRSKNFIFLFIRLMPLTRSIKDLNAKKLFTRLNGSFGLYTLFVTSFVKYFLYNRFVYLFVCMLVRLVDTFFHSFVRFLNTFYLSFVLCEFVCSILSQTIRSFVCQILSISLSFVSVLV